VNPAFERKWGLPAEKVVGLHVSNFMGIENFEQTAKPNLDRCFAGEEVSYGESGSPPLLTAGVIGR